MTLCIRWGPHFGEGPPKSTSVSSVLRRDSTRHPYGAKDSFLFSLPTSVPRNRNPNRGETEAQITASNPLVHFNSWNRRAYAFLLAISSCCSCSLIFSTKSLNQRACCHQGLCPCPPSLSSGSRHRLPSHSCTALLGKDFTKQ